MSQRIYKLCLREVLSVGTDGHVNKTQQSNKTTSRFVVISTYATLSSVEKYLLVKRFHCFYSPIFNTSNEEIYFTVLQSRSSK